MTPRWPARGLYLVTPDDADTGRLLRRVAAVLPYAALLQYRNKQAGDALKLEQSAALRALCQQAGVPLVVNDDPGLAQAARADGVHLGRDDADIAAMRSAMPDAILGASCYDDLERARRATAAGASYLAFGAFFPSPTKPRAPRASPELLAQAGRCGLPLVAIGGITPDNARSLIEAGADLVAVISGVFDAADPPAAARAYRACFAPP